MVLCRTCVMWIPEKGPQQPLLNQRLSSGNLSLTGLHQGFHESRIAPSWPLLELCAREITHTKSIIRVSPRRQTLALPDSHFPWSLSISFRLLKVKIQNFYLCGMRLVTDTLCLLISVPPLRDKRDKNKT